MDVRISVRGIVEFLLRHGDIDNRRNTAGDEAMQIGSRLHRKIQSRMGSEYRAEYPLKYEYETEHTHLFIEGRADGVITLEPSVIIIDEIKSTYRNLDKISEPEPEHLAQAKCYAAIYLMQEGLEQISVRITYVNTESEDIRYFQSHFGGEEIKRWFEELLLEYTRWTDMNAMWLEARNTSIQTLEFPFPYRDGQRDLVGHVYRTIYHGRKLFIEAPTGTGKTMSVLFPAVRSMGEGRGDRIFYLTARTIARTVAEEGMAILKENGLKARNLTLTSKEKICFMEEADCNPVKCPYAKGHFDRINECLYDMVTTADSFDRQLITEYAQKYQVCPFELSLDVSLFADVIICDYNYAFDPNAYLRRFFAAENSEDYLFLIDEAHNLVDRGREMYSAVLVKEDLLKCRKACREHQPAIAAAIDKCNSDMLALKRNSSDTHLTVVTSIEKLAGHADRLRQVISEYLAEHTEGEGHEEILELFFEISSFLNIYDLLDEDYIIYTDNTAPGYFYVKLFNVDPSGNLGRCMGRARSSILFSATLLPIGYYKALLGADKQDYEVYAKSVFDPANRLLFQSRDVSSRYLGRTREQYVKIADYIHRITECRRGNYMIFSPSYSFMYEVYGAYMDEFHDPESEEVICQSGQMNEQAREEFLTRFKGGEGQIPDGVINFEIEVEDRSLLGFCVLGGIFAEGIDLKDDALIGVMIIGTGLPQIGGERDLLRDYFDEKGYDGFDYAYRYPGMNRVMQAAGRLIRTSSDRGVIALLDERYSQAANRRLMPREWSDLKVLGLDEVSGAVSEFWDASDV